MSLLFAGPRRRPFMRQGSRDIRAKERESQQVAGRLPITVAHAITILGMASFLHTMVRITDPEKSRTFYEALGFRFSSEMDIVRNGELEATNYFYSLADQENVLELTYNHDGRMYELGTGYGHIAIGVDDLDATLAQLKEQGIEPERPPYQVREGGSFIAFARDPDDYRIELIEQGR